MLETPLPSYPVLEQDVRVTALASAQQNLYYGFVQQYAGNLSFRDREACYVVEPNGVAMGGGIYGCRLVGSYKGLPLFAATCCVSGSLSSSSSSG